MFLYQAVGWSPMGRSGTAVSIAIAMCELIKVAFISATAVAAAMSW